MIRFKKIIIISFIYLIPLSLLLEVIYLMNGGKKIRRIVEPNNNIFYGILDKCNKEAFIGGNEFRLKPLKLMPDECIKLSSNLKFVLNIKPNFYTKHKANEFNVGIITNKNGFRLPNGNLDSEIITFGDSFTYGHGVSGENRFSHLLSKFCNSNVLNASYGNGFQPEHYAYFFDKNQILKPQIAVVNLFVSNDLFSDINETLLNDYDNELFTLPMRSISEGGVMGGSFNIPEKQNIYKLLFETSKYSAIANLIRYKLLHIGFFGKSFRGSYQIPPEEFTQKGIVSDFYLSRVTYALERIRKIGLSRKNNFQLLVVLIPDSREDLNMVRMKYVNQRILKSLEEKLDNNIQILDMAKYLENIDFFPQDRHYKEKGHLKHARAIKVKLLDMAPEICTNK